MKEESGYILGIETSSRTFSLAIAKGEKLLTLRTRGAGRRLDSLLIPGVKELLNAAGVEKSRLTGIAASTGPGYFTGIRIGLAAAGGMALALKKPAAGIMSLDSIAENTSPAEDSAVCAAIDAGRGEAYYRLYRYSRAKDAREPLAPPGMASVKNLALKLPEKTVFLCASEAVSKQIKEAAGDNAVIMPPEFGEPSAAKTALLGFRKISGGNLSPRELRPVYLRNPDAEVNFSREHAGISIRPAEPGDLDAVMKIERESFPVPWTEAMFKAELMKDSGLFLTAETGGQLAGYACGWYVADEFHLANLAVAPEFRGRGAGKKLLQKVIEDVKSKKARFIALEVRHKNIPAINLYGKFGFKPEARRKGYYSDTKEDAVIMALELEDK